MTSGAYGRAAAKTGAASRSERAAEAKVGPATRPSPGSPRSAGIASSISARS